MALPFLSERHNGTERGKRTPPSSFLRVPQHTKREMKGRREGVLDARRVGIKGGEGRGRKEGKKEERKEGKKEGMG